VREQREVVDEHRERLLSRSQQIKVAERVLQKQGWKAWPVCSRKLGYR
jgi:hypothetical protein